MRWGSLVRNATATGEHTWRITHPIQRTAAASTFSTRRASREIGRWTPALCAIRVRGHRAHRRFRTGRARSWMTTWSLHLLARHVLFHVPRRPSTGARCDGVRAEMSGVSSDRRPPDGGRDRRSDGNRLHLPSHAPSEMQRDSDLYADETISPVILEPHAQDLPSCV